MALEVIKMPVLSKQQVKEAFLELNKTDRSELIQELNENDDALALSEEQLAEIERRLEAYDHDPSRVISGEQFLSKFMAL